MPFRYAREYLKHTYRVLEQGFTRPDPVQIRVGLFRSGVSLSASALLRDAVGFEIVPDNPSNGYLRQVFGQQITAVDITGDVLTVPEHGRAANQECYVISSGTPPSPLAVATPYFVRSPTTNTMQIATISSGSAIDITSIGSGNHYLKMGTAFDTGADNREESVYDEVRFGAIANDILFAGYYCIAESGSAAASVTVTSVNIATDELTCSAAHNLITGDGVLVTIDSGAVQPGGTSASTLYFARSTGSTTLTLHTTAADALANTSKIDITSTGSGFIRVRNSKGILIGWDTFAVATIPAGQSQVLRIPTNILNTGTLQGV